MSGTYTYSNTGNGVHAYIIDTGIRVSHSQFGGRATVAFDAIGDGQNGNDCNGHGTHVAGTVGGTVYGVAKGVRLYAVRVLNCSGSGTNSGVIAGVDWVRLNAQRPAVAKMSLGGGASSALDTAVNNAINAGITFALAAGNSNRNACNFSPARVAAGITVGATTSTDARASYSNYGSCLDLFAPGSSITSAWISSDTSTNTISGTLHGHAARGRRSSFVSAKQPRGHPFHGAQCHREQRHLGHCNERRPSLAQPFAVHELLTLALNPLFAGVILQRVGLFTGLFRCGAVHGRAPPPAARDC